MRRPVAAVLTGLLLAVWAVVGAAPPASADPVIEMAPDCSGGSGGPTPSPSPSPSPTPTPSPDCTPTAGQVLRGEKGIAFRVSAPGLERLRRVAIDIENMDPDAPEPVNPVLEEVYDYGDNVDARDYRFIWDTVGLTPFNGAYRVRIEAQAQTVTNENSSNAFVVRENLRVDNPPATPAPPRVVETSPGVATVAWGEAPEPDNVSYTLYRAPAPDGSQQPPPDAYEPIVVTSKTQVADEAPPGVYRYRLRTTRRSIVTPDEGISSPLSVASGAATVAEATPSPSPSDEGGGGSTDGGSETVERSRSRPRLTPRPLARGRSGAPLPSDAPYSDVLPYDLPGQPVGGASFDEVPGDGGGEGGDPSALPVVAMGSFLVAAALALSRLPT